MQLPDRTLGERCASDLRLDRWLAGELPSAEAREVAAHVARCPRCADRHAHLESERAAFLARAPRFTPPAPRRTRWQLPALALAAAAAVAVAVLPREAPDATRTKGSEHIGFYVKSGGSVRRGGPDESVQPGDQLRFVYSSSRDRYLAILSLDSAGKTSIYFPAGERAERIVAGSGRPLPNAVELDDVLGTERIVALFCDTPVRLAPLTDSFAKGELSAPSGCVSSELRLRKSGEPHEPQP